MEKYGKIKGLTLLYEDNEKLLHRGLLLRYANEDVSFDIEKKIDYELDVLREQKFRTANYNNSYADFTYWKYLFLSCKKNKYKNMDKALNYLKEAYKKGSPDAIAQYAYYYYTGTVITDTIDKAKAKKLFAKAFEVSKARSKNDQVTPFVEYLYAEAIQSDAGENKNALREAAKYYEIALKERKVVFCKKTLGLIYLTLRENIEEAADLLADACTMQEFGKIIVDYHKNKKLR